MKAREDKKFKETIKKELLQQFGIKWSVNLKTESDKIKLSDLHFLMYAPTFRGGSQGTNREIAAIQGFPDYKRLIANLQKRVWRNLDYIVSSTSAAGSKKYGSGDSG